LDGVPSACAVLPGNLATIRKSMVDEYVTGLGKPRMQKVFRAIRFAFGIPDSSGSICLFVTIE
jgi:hypothetical protein